MLTFMVLLDDIYCFMEIRSTAAAPALSHLASYVAYANATRVHTQNAFVITTPFLTSPVPVLLEDTIDFAYRLTCNIDKVMGT